MECLVALLPNKTKGSNVIFLMRCIFKVVNTLLFSFIILTNTYAQSINNLNGEDYHEGDIPLRIDSNIGIEQNGFNFAGATLEIRITNPDSLDFLDIEDGGRLSKAGNALLWNDARIGTINHINNGLNGKALQIIFQGNTLIPYADFESGDLTSWHVDTTMNQMIGQSWAQGPPPGFETDTNATVDDHKPYNLFPGSSNAKVTEEARHSGKYGLRLDMSGRIFSYNDLGSEYGYGTIHSPSVVSAPFFGQAGDSISLWYNAANTVRTDDYKDIFGFVFIDANNNAKWDEGEFPQQLFRDFGPATDEWINRREELNLTGDNLRFWFLNGSYDYRAGFKVGCDLYIDDIYLKPHNYIEPNTEILKSVIEHITYENKCGRVEDRNFEVKIINGSDSIVENGTIGFYSEPPVFSLVQDITLSVNEASCSAILVEYPEIIATDSCSVVIHKIAGIGEAGQYPWGPNTETWVATDASGNTDTMSFTINIIDTVPPVIDTIEDIYVLADSGKCSVTLADYPEIDVPEDCGISYEKIAGLGRSGEFPLGETTETWIATDIAGNSDTISFNVIVEPVNSPPSMDNIEEIVGKENESITIPIAGISTGKDCEEQLIDTIICTFDNTDLVGQLTVNFIPGDTVGSIVIDFVEYSWGTVNVKLLVKDNGGTENGGVDSLIKEFAVVVEDVNHPPYVLNPIEDKEVNVGKTLEMDIPSALGEIFDDVDNDQMEISVSLESGEELPPWGYFSGELLRVTPLEADTGLYNILVTAKDVGGLVATDVFKIQIIQESTGIDELEKFVFLKLYPNPTRSMVNIEINGNYHSGVEVSVLNISGKEVYRNEYSITNIIQFSLDNCIAGMYFIKLKIDGVEVIKKLILEQ